MNGKCSNTTAMAGLVTLLVCAGVYTLPAAHAEERSAAVDYTAMSPEQLANHLIFEAKGFAVDDKTQEGTTVGERLKQDELQKTCSALRGGEVDSATAKKVTALAKESMIYPEGGIEPGDWKKGQAVAENAFGYRVGHKVDDHSGRSPGGMCINCHKLEQDKALRSGTLGPSLIGYGNERGRSDEVVKYTYEMIYNPHAAFPCTKMPRLGANGFITREQILDVLAYLLDPESPVNQ